MRNAAAGALCPGIDAIVTACQPIEAGVVWTSRLGDTGGRTHKINLSWAGICAVGPEEDV